MDRGPCYMSPEQCCVGLGSVIWALSSVIWVEGVVYGAGRWYMGLDGLIWTVGAVIGPHTVLYGPGCC